MDLLPRVCKTYLQAIAGEHLKLPTAYGGVAGLGALGGPVVR